MTTLSIPRPPGWKAPLTDAERERQAWERALDAALELGPDGRAPFECVGSVALDGIALVPSRSVELQDHEVTVQDVAAVKCTCQYGKDSACAHRMAMAIALWLDEQMQLGGILPGSADADYIRRSRVHLVPFFIERYLTPSLAVRTERKRWLKERLLAAGGRLPDEMTPVPTDTTPTKRVALL